MTPFKTTTETSRASLGDLTHDRQLTLAAWRDDVVEAHPDSHPAASIDTLVWWTPTLGPSATLMLHRFAGHLAHGGRTTFTAGELARTFGLGQSLSRVRSTLLRLERFQLISVWDDTVRVRLALPPLAQRQLDQLPPYLRGMYESRSR